ncbi:hypothetical protein DPMN_012512 [Dreissena polymorpha]|uniref:Uncharacterized protein n=1 Tax=Dreissena polymorpha TaxID=45954 RepID=A0A9D4N854_DREPO|nr:hypothetical protein DPMN_012512 [Dreissena polymorpha]
MGEGNVCGGIVVGEMSREETSLGRGASGIPAKGDSVVNVPLEEIIKGKYSLLYAHQAEAFLSTSIGTAILSAFERDITVSCTAVDEAHMIPILYLFLTL